MNANTIAVRAILKTHEATGYGWQARLARRLGLSRAAVSKLNTRAEAGESFRNSTVTMLGSQAQSAPASAPASELSVLESLCRSLEAMPADARPRTLAYLASRFGGTQ